MSRLTARLFTVALSHLAFLTIAPNALSQNLSVGSASGFGLLGLDNGNVSINLSTQLVGDVGYSNGVDSVINQKAENFAGSALVHSGATFSYEASNFLPSGGIQSGAGIDSRLNQANADILRLAGNLSGLGATQSGGFLADDDSRIFVSNAALNVIDVTGVSYNSDTLTLQSRTGLSDTFVIRVSGNFTFSQSEVILDGITAENVIFYFPNASSILVNKDASDFHGTILAPTGSVVYHNAAQFSGAIIAKNIDVHSAFNLEQVTFVVPEPSAALLGLAGLGLVLFRRKRWENM